MNPIEQLAMAWQCGGNDPIGGSNRKDKNTCTARGGECRTYGPYYTGTLYDKQSWEAPIAGEFCNPKCPYLKDYD